MADGKNSRCSALASFLQALFFSALAMGLFPAASLLPGPAEVAPSVAAVLPAEVVFMRGFIARVNPALLVEDDGCALGLPAAILRHSENRRLDWRRVLALAWQESSFDCHAKNPFDRGGAYGPFQIRRLWEPLIGDPRRRYFDPELAAKRVTEVLAYYRDTPRFKVLTGQRFRNPLLCLYNTGEVQRVRMRYCRRVGWKLKAINRAWSRFEKLQLAKAGEPESREKPLGG